VKIQRALLLPFSEEILALAAMFQWFAGTYRAGSGVFEQKKTRLKALLFKFRVILIPLPEAAFHRA
jgi:hypothetical protein